MSLLNNFLSYSFFFFHNDKIPRPLYSYTVTSTDGDPGFNLNVSIGKQGVFLQSTCDICIGVGVHCLFAFATVELQTKKLTLVIS